MDEEFSAFRRNRGIKEKATWVIGAFAECEDCGWVSGNYKNAQAVGANHAKHHNHFVRVETTLVLSLIHI